MKLSEQSARRKGLAWLFHPQESRPHNKRRQSPHTVMLHEKCRVRSGEETWCRDLSTNQVLRNRFDVVVYRGIKYRIDALEYEAMFFDFDTKGLIDMPRRQPSDLGGFESPSIEYLLRRQVGWVEQAGDV